MKKITKIICIIFLTIFVLLGWFAYRNWNTIDAIIHSFNTTADETLQELEESKKELQVFLEEEENIVVRDLTEEESKAFSEGKLTEQEIIEIITGQDSGKEIEVGAQQSGDGTDNQTSEEQKPIETSEPTGSHKPVETQKPGDVQKPVETQKPGKTQKPESTTKPTSAPTAKPTVKPTQKPMSESDKKVSELIAKLYVQKSIYLGKLDGIEAKVRSEYLSNPKKWGSKKNAKNALLNKYMPEVASWEKQCDSTVYGILDEIRAELKKQGKDDSVVNTMKKAYLDEKKLKKTYFINRYMD